MICYLFLIAVIPFIESAGASETGEDDEICPYDMPVRTTPDEIGVCNRCNPSNWRQLIYVNTSDPASACPTGWPVYSQGSYGLSVTACGGGYLTGCVSVTSSNGGQAYSRVCGRVYGYQWQQPNAFHGLISGGKTIEDNYLDGVSITHGSSGSRQHIWSFASASRDVGISSYGCPCSYEAEWDHDISFVGNDYFCDIAWEGPESATAYSSNTLWDGVGCGPTNSCCEFNNLPYFCRTLPQPTTDDLEVRVCSSDNFSTDIVTYLIEIYAQ